MNQNYQKQVKLLEEIGAIIMPSNAQAARMAALIATKGEIQDFL